MRILRALTIVLIAGIAGIIIHSCCEGYEYRWTYIIAENFKNDTTRNTYGMPNVIAAFDSVERDLFGIRVHFFKQKYTAFIQGFSDNNLYAAYDCWPLFVMEDTITDIDIITLNKFNEEADSGDEVSRYFDVEYPGNGWDLNTKIQWINEDDRSVLDNLQFFINDNTVKDSVQQFIIRVYLSNNTAMSDTTEPVILY